MVAAISVTASSARRHDELGELAGDVNAMADDVEAMLDAKRALLIGISHELRSPLSRLQLASEFVDDAEFRDELRREVAEMESIIGVLLVAETLNSRHAALNCEQVDISRSAARSGRPVFCTAQGANRVADRRLATGRRGRPGARSASDEKPDRECAALRLSRRLPR